MLPIQRKRDGCVKKDPVITGKKLFSLQKLEKHELVLASQPPLSLELALAFKPVLLHT